MQKLELTPIGQNNKLDVVKRVTVQFNPNAYSITKTVEWTEADAQDKGRNAPLLQYKVGNARTLSMDLFFDVTEPVDRNGFREPLDDVRVLTNRIKAFTEINSVGNNQHRPPLVRLDWGGAPPRNSDFPFIGVITSLTQKYTLFSSIGRPLRATLSLSFKESSDPTLEKLGLLKAESTKLQKIVRGVSVARVAAGQYGDPKFWKKIATANKIKDPLRLDIGGYLKLPKN